MKPIRSIAFLPLILLASCGTSSDKNKSSAASSSGPAHVPFSQRIGSGGGRDPNSYQKDSAGKYYIKEEKRSPYESKGEASFASKSYKKEEYKAGDYAKKSWWGNKEYDRKAYSGNTDASRFQTPSNLDGKGAREAGNQADIPDKYKTGGYATGDARESTAAQIPKGTSAAIENRKDSYEQPEIIGWKEQRNLNVDQAKSILGH
ncbi:hypothetical protein [Luteolibacter sp.]|uniref:hypothetical protein n=1 Tax=Luteolibacter sp. TaxID=1962973 RepID=UPI00326702BF